MKNIRRESSKNRCAIIFEGGMIDTDRLTKRTSAGEAQFVRELAIDSQAVCEKLAAYEDTGLSPERIQQFQERIKLVGQIAYFVVDLHDEMDVEPLLITEVGTKGFWVPDNLNGGPDEMSMFTAWDEVGKTIFFTEVEANAEAERMKVLKGYK